jgi:putative DNA primase/helicase
VLETALAWHQHNCAVVPARADGTKAPAAYWKRYITQRPTLNEILGWFTTDQPGLGLVCGAVSGGLEMLELEGRAVAEGAIAEITTMLIDAGLGELWIRLTAEGYAEHTPSGGLHLLYRVANMAVPGNTKLAARPAHEHELTAEERTVLSSKPDKVFHRDLAETRGEGGYVVIAPSNGPTHPSGRPWKLVYGSPGVIPTITAAEREQLHRIFRCLDRVPSAEPVEARTLQIVRAPDDLSPGTDFEAKVDWADGQLLGGAGWQCVTQRDDGYRTWRRPGKDGPGISATTGRDRDRDRLYVFSSSTEFDTEVSITKFHAYAVLHHGGNHSAAGRALRQAGYGNPTIDRAAADRAAIHELLPEVDTPGKVGINEPHTDLGNAHRLVAGYGHKLRHVPAWGKWYIWDGRRWAVDLTGQVDRYAKTVARRLLEEAKAEADEELRKKLLVSARRAESASGIRAMLELAATEAGVALAPTDLDAHPHLLNTTTGTLDLRTAQLSPHDPALHLTKITSAGYVPGAACPEFTRFLDRVQPEPEMRSFVARLLGHTLTGEVLEHILAILHGSGANGKTTLTEIVRKVLGDYAATTDPGLLIDRGDHHPTGIADLFGLRLALTFETDSGRRLAEGTIKRLTGGDRIKARRMREDFWEFDPTHSILMITNHKPIVTGDDEGIWRRLRLVPFDVTIPAGERDAKLPGRLEAEADAILGFLVEGYREYLSRGLAEPSTVTFATDSYRKESDALGRFLDECCLIMAGCRVASAELYAAWGRWCSGEGCEVGTQKAFSTKLINRGFDKRKVVGRETWQGLGLQANEAERGGQ